MREAAEEYLRQFRRQETTSGEFAIAVAIAAQAEATLALADEQRTANLLRMWEVRGAFTDGDWPQDPESGDLFEEIKRRLPWRTESS